MRRQLVLAVVCSVLAASCGGQRADEERPAQEAAPACVGVDSDLTVCGLAPPTRRVDAGTAYKLTTILGESFWVILPGELTRTAEVVAVPQVPARAHAGLSTATARQLADWWCDDDLPSCKPEVVRREALPNGTIVTRWRDESGATLTFDLTTVELGKWTLDIYDPDANAAERFARALKSSVDEDGYPRLASTDPEVALEADWDSVLLLFRGPGAREAHHIEVMPGCDLAAKKPDLGGSVAGPGLELHEGGTVFGGRWCVDGRYWVDVWFIDRDRLERFHQELRIVPSLG